MTGYTITPESSISGNWMDFILIYTLSFSLTHRLNPCMGFHPLPSPAITHFTPIIIIPTRHSRQVQRKCSMLAFMNRPYVFKEIINLSASVLITFMKMYSLPPMPTCPVTLHITKTWIETFLSGTIWEILWWVWNWCLKRCPVCKEMFEKLRWCQANSCHFQLSN